jgi:hypothetical protein
MPSLRDLQRAMSAGILDGAPPAALLSLVRAEALPADGRLRIYRNNTFISLTEALKASFPVVLRLVGDGFFQFAADAFIRANPPTSPRIALYGAAFADFLSAFEPARRLPYLPDVARLEWAINESFHAVDAHILDPKAIAAIPVARYADLIFVMHPSCRLIASPYPIEHIWRANQPDRDGAASLDERASHLLVHRHELDVRFIEVGRAGHAFLAAIGAGRFLGQAYEEAALVDPDFELVSVLSGHMARGTFTTFLDLLEADGDES